MSQLYDPDGAQVLVVQPMLVNRWWRSDDPTKVNARPWSCEAVPYAHVYSGPGQGRCRWKDSRLEVVVVVLVVVCTPLNLARFGCFLSCRHWIRIHGGKKIPISPLAIQMGRGSFAGYKMTSNDLKSGAGEFDNGGSSVDLRRNQTTKGSQGGRKGGLLSSIVIDRVGRHSSVAFRAYCH